MSEASVSSPSAQAIEAETLIAAAMDRAMKGDVPGIVAALRSAASVAPAIPMTAIRMAEIDAQTSRIQTARRWLERAGALASELSAAAQVLALVLKEEGRIAVQSGNRLFAARLWRCALVFEPADSGLALDFAGLQSSSATKLRFLRRSLAIRQWAGAFINIGNVEKGKFRLCSAVGQYRTALALEPDNSFALNNLATTLRDCACIAEALRLYLRAVAAAPANWETESNYLQALQFDCKSEEDFIVHAHRSWSKRHADALSGDRRDYKNSRNPDRQLKIGYISPDFRRHPVGFFLLPTLEARSCSSHYAVCYSTSGEVDAVTIALRAAVDQWVEASSFGDDSLAAKVEADEIDILVDLSGHTAHNRLRVFARRPAPIQASWLGYFDTTGMSAMQYVVTDAWEVPAGVEGRYSEEVVRLSAGRFAYRPPAYAPDVVTPPSERTGAITFGSFNNLGKLSESTIRIWSVLLSKVPSSRLLLKWSSLADEGVAGMVRAHFSRYGVAPERLILRGASPHEVMLDEYGELDIALDPFPFSGCLTTVEGLWMGVPFVTFAGARPVSRQSAAILQRIGLGELVASDEASYIDCAADLAFKPNKLSELRLGMRNRMRASTILDGSAVAESLESAYREMWRKWCLN